MKPDHTSAEVARLRESLRFWKFASLLAIVFALGWTMATVFNVAHAEEAGPTELHLIRTAVQEMAKDTRELRKTPAAIDDLRKTCKK